jgi:predicted transcriptional regulator
MSLNRIEFCNRRMEAGILMVECAKDLGISNRWLCGIESGWFQPGDDLERRMIAYFEDVLS